MAKEKKKRKKKKPQTKLCDCRSELTTLTGHAEASGDQRRW